MSKKAVLISGGPDSTVLVHDLVSTGADVVGIHLDLGDFEAEAGRLRAERVAARLGVQMVSINLSDALQQLYRKPMPYILRAAHVAMRVEPFGAGVALSMAASVALGVGASSLYYGVHRGDTVYKDNSPAFFEAMSTALSIDQGREFSIVTPFLDMEKSEVFARGAALGVDLADTWSCTEGSEIHCGVCLACGCREIAFRDAALGDSTAYSGRRSLVEAERDFATLAAELSL